MSLFNNFNVLVIRRPSGSYDNDGLWNNGAPETFYVKTSFQPVKGEELNALPEGRRERAQYKMYPYTLLKTIDEQQPDVVISPLDGRQYEVIALENNRNGLINHCKAILGLKTTADIYNYQLELQDGYYILLQNDLILSL